MNRRGFLGLLAGSAAVAILPEPTSRTIFLPPRGGWRHSLGVIDFPSGNSLLSLAQIKREIEFVITQELTFHDATGRKVDPEVAYKTHDGLARLTFSAPAFGGVRANTLRVGDRITIAGLSR